MDFLIESPPPNRSSPFVKFHLLPIILLSPLTLNAQEKIIPGATEDSPSQAHYFTWINNTNEGQPVSWVQDLQGVRSLRCS